jgi:hypothetical protein
MIVNGYEVPWNVESACTAEMQNSIEFRASDIAFQAQTAGAPNSGKNQGLCDRIADRLIQRERKAKRIKVVKYPYWQWARAL